MKKRKTELTKKIPTHWCMGWDGEVELGFADGKYLPRRAALILYPEYFKDGEPIMEKLPSDSRRFYMTEEQKKRADEIQKELRKVEDTIERLISHRHFYKRKGPIARFFCNSVRDEYDEIYLPSKVRHEIVQILINYENELKEEFAKL